MSKVTSPAELNSKDVKRVLSLISEHAIEFVDLRFTDMNGIWHHITQAASTITKDSIEEGFLFDGSSITGWKSIEDSDTLLRPDLATATIDPFSARPQLILICDIFDPRTNEPYSRDPRATARRAEAYLKSSGIADDASFGPEAEFFIFDNARFGVTENHSGYQIDSIESDTSALKEFPEGNMGHRPGQKGGYLPVPPVDTDNDLRAEMLSTMKDMGLDIEKHHHEVASAQHELGFRFQPLLKAADHIQIYKYCVHNVAHSYGKTATFLPKPLLNDNGSGMHVHQSLWKDGKPMFAGDDYAGLSENALFYIGGILKHAKALNAFTNPTTNSYKRLVPGFEAPVLLAYSGSNRSAACRIPLANNEKAKRIEVRFPDAMANPYMAFTAMLMAGLDGIKNKIDPGKAAELNLYNLEDKELAKIPTVSASLREALDALKKDNDFLLEGGVFTKDQIDAFIEVKLAECRRYDRAPHPIEFVMYYSR